MKKIIALLVFISFPAFAGQINNPINFSGQPIVYASNYGVTANAVSLIDISSTSSSATISSGSYTFTSGDAGKVINVWAGTNVSTTGTTVTGSRVITALASTTGIATFQEVIGTGIPNGSYVVAVDTTNNIVYLNQGTAATASASGVTLTFVNPISTNISSVSAGNAILATTAGTTITAATRAIFGTDDTTALQNTVTAATQYGTAVIALSKGSSMITNQINSGTTWPSNISLIGQARDVSSLVWAASTSMGTSLPAVIYNGSTSYATSMSNVVFAHFTIDMSAATDSPYNYNGTCIRGVYNRDVTITDMKFIGSPATCLGMDYPQRLIVTNNIFEGDARLGVGGGGSFAILLGEVANNPEDFVFSNNEIFNTGVFGVMAENTFASGSNPTISADTAIIANNHIYYDAYQPNATFVYGIQDAGMYGAQIIGNVIQGPAINSSLWVGIGTGCGDHTCYNGQSGMNGRISNNTVTGLGTPYYINGLGVSNYTIEGNVANLGGRSSTACYGLNNSTTNAMNNIAFRNNIGWECAGSGIGILGGGSTANTNITIENNKMVDNGSGSGSAATGYAFSAPVTNLIMVGNEAYDDGASYQKYGLGVSSGFAIGGNTFITNNNFKGNTTGSLSISGTISGIMTDNLGPRFTVSGCSASTPVGNADNGTFVSGTTGTCTVTVLFNGVSTITSPNGYACGQTLTDLTTNADTLKLTAETTDSCTYSGTTVSGDVINLSKAQPF